ncbi:hypothetical protein K1719_039406 [Acacia pycnantha]|nr:hypothetical protein K1719_039406 [Acacia pycnantha]
MPATDFQNPSPSLAHFGRAIRSLRRDHIQVHSMEGSATPQHNPNSNLEQELESFQKQVTDKFLDLSSVGQDDLLSLSWVWKLLDSFIYLHEEFRYILRDHRALVSKAPVDRMMTDLFERNVKALDVCNAIRDGIDEIRQWQKLLEIVLCALNNQKSIGEGQYRRAKKALIELSIGMLDDKDSNASVAQKNRSFSRNSAGRDHHHHNHNHHHRFASHFRSLSCSVSRNWSAAKQLLAIGNNLNAPRGNDLVASNGLAVIIFTMSSILLFVMWALVAAIPCQDRGLLVQFSIPRTFSWAAPLLSMYERIMDESKKRERRNSRGLLKEIHQIEKCTRLLNELGDSVCFPLAEEKEGEIRHTVQEVSQVCEALRDGLDPLDRHVREVFQKIVQRTQGLDTLGRLNHHES